MNLGGVEFQKPYLDFLWLEITSKCNLECLHCYAESSPRENIYGAMRTDDWLRIIEDAADLGCQKVQFIGGEPTLHPALGKLLTCASLRGYDLIEVFTNATNLTNSVLRPLLKYDVHVATSFYSYDSKTHDVITKRKGSFERTVAGIQRIVAAGLRLRVGIIEMEENLGHSLGTKRFLEELGVSNIQLDHQRGFGRAAQRTQPLDPLKELCGECWKGKLCVTAEGRAYPCTFSRFQDLGPIARGIKNILVNSSLVSFRSLLREYQQKRQSDSASSCRPTCAPGASFCVPISYCQPDHPSPSCQPDLPPTPCEPSGTSAAPSSRPAQ